MKLPTYNDNSHKGEQGLTIAKLIVERDLKWIFRKNHKEHDFGIDAFIDLANQHNQITGKSIALQIKTGASYFSEKISTGWVYRDNIAHLNYYLNHDIPVLILLVDDQEEKVYWNVCEASKIEKAGDNWKIIIPALNEFNAGCKKEIEKYVSPVRDYEAQLDHFWTMNNLLKDSGLLAFNVDRDYIEKKDYKGLEAAINRLQVNPDLIEKMKGKVDIWIDGYHEDRRELYEIPEVIEWVHHLMKHVSGLSYFLSTFKTSSFLRIMQYVNTKYEIVENNVLRPDGKRGKQTVIDLTTGEPFLNELFQDLNSFCGKHKIPMEVNRERTFAIVEFLTDRKIPGYLKG